MRLGRLVSGGDNLLVVEVETTTVNLARQPPQSGAQPEFVFRLKGVAQLPAVRAEGSIAMAISNTRITAELRDR